MRFQNIRLDPQGAAFDTDPHDVPEEFWTDVLNMRFIDNAAEKMGGDEEQTTTTGQGTHLLFNGNHDDPLWLYFGDGVARVTNFTLDKDIEGAALGSGANWDTSLFNLFPICNNTVDAPRYWDKDFVTPGTLATLPAFPANTTCQSISPFRSFLVAMNITVSAVDSPNRVIWSDQSDSGALPASWDISDPSTLSGDQHLTDDRGEIIGGYQLRDFFVIYKTHSTYLMRLIGGQSIMRFDKVQVHSGLLTKNSVTEFKGRHFVASDGDIVLFDGQNIQSIADKWVRRQIFNSIDDTNYVLAHAARYDKKNEIWFNYPTSGQPAPNMAAIWNWRDDKWTFRELFDTKYVAAGVGVSAVTTIDGLTGSIDALDSTFRATIDAPASNPTADTLHMATTLAIHAVDLTNDFDGSPMSSRLEKVTMDLGDPDSIKLVDSISPRITADNGTIIHIRIGAQFNPDEAISWLPEKTYTVGTDRQAHFSAKGRFISVRMRTDGTNVNWKCHGFLLRVKSSGRH